MPVAFLNPHLVDSDGPAFDFTKEGSFIVGSEFSRAGLVEDGSDEAPAFYQGGLRRFSG